MAYINGSDYASYLMDPNTPWKMQTPQVLPPFGDAQGGFWGSSWSPDGRAIAGAVISVDSSGAGVVVYSLEPKQYQRLTEFGTQPVWLADSRRLLFRDQGALFRVDSLSGETHEILSIAPDAVSYPSISRDNRWIYFNRRSTQADIWMLTLDGEQN
jgi:Tol biopolymer transport system component